MKNNFQIRKAQTEDLEAIVEIYTVARRFMAENGNPRQWGATNWPPKALLEKDIEVGKLYVCTHESELAGVFYYDHGTNIESTYKAITDGKWRGGDTYGVVHRLASSGKYKGVGAFCINWAHSQCGYLRIDTHGDNKPMQSLLPKLGFEYSGIIYVEEDNDPRLAYEKLA